MKESEVPRIAIYLVDTSQPAHERITCGLDSGACQTLSEFDLTMLFPVAWDDSEPKALPVCEEHLGELASRLFVQLGKVLKEDV
jgi:hypothetical protein